MQKTLKCSDVGGFSVFSFTYKLSGVYCSNKKMEHTGFEPVTSTLPVWRAPSCANAPCD